MSHSFNKPLVGRVPIEHKPEDFLDKGDNLLKKPSIGARIKQEAHDAKEWLKARVTPENSMPIPSSDKVLRRTDGHTMHPDHKIPEHYDINKLPGHYDPDMYHPAPIAPSNQLHNIDVAAPSSHEMAGSKATKASLLADKQRVFEERKETAPLERVGPIQQREYVTKASKPPEHNSKTFTEQFNEKLANTWEKTKSKVVEAKDWVAEKVTSDSPNYSSDKFKSTDVEMRGDRKDKVSESKDEKKEWADGKINPESEKTLTEKIKNMAASAWFDVKYRAAETQDWLERNLPSDSEKMSSEIKETPIELRKVTPDERKDAAAIGEQYAKLEKIDL